jgi:hypothetical protein
MTLVTISLERFAEELGGLHGWSNPAIDEFKAATTHEALPREDWVRIAGNWAIYESSIEGVPSPLLFVAQWGIALAINGKLGAIDWRPSGPIAQHDADELNDILRESGEFDTGTRWYAVKAQVQFSDSE